MPDAPCICGRRTIIARRFYRTPGPVQKTRVNHEIRLSPIMLIDHNNRQVGEIETREAQAMADEAGLDLVEIQPNVRPPLCKIMDYGKYKFELGKKERSQKAAGKGNEMKEVRLGRSIKIDPHDVGIRVNKARGFLMDGHKVLLVQQFRGREMAHRELGVNRLREICTELADVAKVEVPPKTMGRRMSLILSPDRQKIEIIKRKLEREKAKLEAEAAPAKKEEKAPKAEEKPQVEAPVEAEAEVKDAETT